MKDSIRIGVKIIIIAAVLVSLLVSCGDDNTYIIGSTDTSSNIFEIDLHDKITMVGNRIDFTELGRNDPALIYMDYGEDYFSTDDNFVYNFTVMVTDTYGTNGFVQVFALTNIIGDNQDLLNNMAIEDFIHVAVFNSAQAFYLRTVASGSAVAHLGSATWQPNVQYWLKIWIEPGAGAYGTIHADIYTDAAMTSLFESLSVAQPAYTSFRYLLPFAGADVNNLSYTDWWTGFIEIL